MRKVIDSGSFEQLDGPAASMLKVSSRGTDHDQLTKLAMAGPLADVAANLKPKKGHSYIHLVTLADMFTYGANRNADAFPGDRRTITFPEPKPGVNPTYKMASCLAEKHKTFTTHAHVFKHHRNTSSDPVFGDIVADAYSQTLKRGELIAELPNEKWEEELEKLANGEDLPFSMACFVRGTLVQTKNGFKCIEKIAVGDEVLTHEGEYRKVEALQSRETRAIYTVMPYSNVAFATDVTEEHPFYAAHISRSDRTSLVHKGIDDISEELSKRIDWVEAKELGTRHYLVVPIKRDADISLSSADARLLAYWSVLKESQDGDRFRMKLNGYPEQLSRELKALCGDCGGTHISIKNVAGVDMFMFTSRRFKELLESVSQYADVYEYIFHTNEAAVVQFLGALFNVRGHSDSRGIHWRVPSKKAAMLIGLCMFSMYMPAHTIKISGRNDDYQVSLPHTYHNVFDSICWSAWPSEGSDGYNRIVFTDKYAFLPVKDVKRKRQTATVYNMSVADHNSYTANGVAVHNCNVPYDVCSVCGNKAATKYAYCDHIRYQKGQITKTGHQVAMINDDPTFIDISYVYRPADSIAWSLAKVASIEEVDSLSGLLVYDDQTLQALRPDLYVDDPFVSMGIHKAAAWRKLSAIEKEIMAIGKPLPTHPILGKAEALDESCGYGISDMEADALRRGDIGTVLGRFADSFVCLPFRAFYKLVLGSKNYQQNSNALDEALKALPGSFLRMSPDDICSVPSVELNDGGFIPNDVERVIKTIVPRMTLDAPVTRRVSIAIIKGASVKSLAKVSSDVRLTDSAEFFAKEYMKYQLAVAERWMKKSAADVTLGLLVLSNWIH